MLRICIYLLVSLRAGHNMDLRVSVRVEEWLCIGRLRQDFPFTAFQDNLL